MNINNLISPIRGPNYIRVVYRERKALEESLSTLYQKNERGSTVNPKACIFPSGNNAIYHLFLNTIIRNMNTSQYIRFIVGDELYTDTTRTLDYLTKQFSNFSYTPINITDQQALADVSARYGKQIKLLFIESCTNPSGHMPDFSFLSRLRNKYQYPIIVDNTWLSAILFNPFHFNADGVIISLTKYYSKGQCIAGALLGHDNILTPITEDVRISGLHVSPLHCQVVLESLNDLQSRITETSTKALSIAQWLESHPKVNRILYPLLPSHPSYAVNKQQLPKGGPGCMWFHISSPREEISTQVAQSRNISYKTSFGGKDTRIDSFPKQGFANKYNQHNGNFIDGTWVRLAIGYADAMANIQEGLERFLDF